MNVLLVSPTTPDTFWSFRHVLPLLRRKSAFPPLGLLTVAAMLPAQWRLKLVDMDVTDLEDADIDWADWVMLSGMIIHTDSCRVVAARSAAREKPVIAGGPLFTTGHEQFPEIPHFVLGEAEDVMPGLVADMIHGTARDHYESPRKPDVTQTPVPRWDLVRFKDYVTAPVQFSRGCPFDCEFCDIPVMYGRTPRVKAAEQVIRELDALIEAGWRESIFIVDDNFIGHKTKAKALLRAIIAWRRDRAVRIPFLTEASLNLVDDDELLRLMVDAGFKKVFVGVETPISESLAECGKVQNTGRDLVAAVKKMQNAGLEVMGGFIVGFDNDQPNVFERQRAFIQETGIVTAMVGLLNALPKTRLFTRLSAEGRILQKTTGNNLDAVLNFVSRIDRDVLIDGYRSLVNQLYAPKPYYRRITTFLREYRPNGPRTRPTHGNVAAFVRSLWILGVRSRGRHAYWSFLVRSLLLHRHKFAEAMSLAILGHHFRKVAESL
ncbi:MAG: B12-binding domain-containing radical SAM protein [Phycisphaerales bacterium]|nr:B12-binding domain-containing radical SAM protein [Phycisphaerales bacterium]